MFSFLVSKLPVVLIAAASLFNSPVYAGVVYYNVATSKPVPVSALVDSTSKSGVTAVSDTVISDNTDNDKDEDADDILEESLVNEMFNGHGFTFHALGGICVALFAIFCIFCLPILGICFILYLIFHRNKRRDDQYQFTQSNAYNAQTGAYGANGTSNSAETANAAANNNSFTVKSDEFYRIQREGITKMALGVGLAIFLWTFLGWFGFGIGALVFCIGAGKYIIAYTDERHYGSRQQYNQQNNQQNNNSANTSSSSDVQL